MSLSQPLNPLRTRDSAHRQQSTGNLSWKSAGSGFESLAAHKSPGQSADLGFFMPAGHLLFDLFSHAALPPTGPCGLQVIVTVRHITECLAPAFEQFPRPSPGPWVVDRAETVLDNAAADAAITVLRDYGTI